MRPSLRGYRRLVTANSQLFLWVTTGLYLGVEGIAPIVLSRLTRRLPRRRLRRRTRAVHRSSRLFRHSRRLSARRCYSLRYRRLGRRFRATLFPVVVSETFSREPSSYRPPRRAEDTLRPWDSAIRVVRRRSLSHSTRDTWLYSRLAYTRNVNW